MCYKANAVKQMDITLENSKELIDDGDKNVSEEHCKKYIPLIKKIF